MTTARCRQFPGPLLPGLRLCFPTVLALTGLVSAGLALAASARADIPNRCDAPAILTEIARLQDSLVMNREQTVRITGFTAIESRGTAPRATPPGARRFCAAQARLGDNSTRPIWYVLDEDAADGGARPRVDFCIAGLDPDRRHGADCEAVK
ncbi:hypothetical protein BJF92_01920 [Rhizobium rhizosphaerae]|uniref:Uncharacterized protein n=1 Tax=Xaviernesmea rhizosphaerae TaxID=1672749 RepID=A0A1Q9AKP7_9HYPH|nr:hypothetical protein [Xaviernesmea rhizosphaerae]OLP55893.1 hypothetical protein BJF92_01920 [Xaviernesmea rhizosphaerae]